ncbi:MAG: hypothetical protein WAV45_11030 [Propionibacteriaceae bacterium]|jgi:hypothetical protein|nr:hypothetical protein [Micropruina sp.]HBX82691.1 hypothetical protein [Propionibacteriaceae bacterium]
MKILVLSGVLRCGHDGKVTNQNRQSWVRIAAQPLLVATDPEGRDISMCPNISTNTKQCNTTLMVVKGYSAFLRIDGNKVCLDSVDGMTDGVPPSHYTVRDPGQQFVGADR